MAVHHALFVVLGDAVGGAEGDDDGVVGGCQVDVGDTGACIGGVDDGLAVRAVRDADTGFDGSAAELAGLPATRQSTMANIARLIWPFGRNVPSSKPMNRWFVMA